MGEEKFFEVQGHKLKLKPVIVEQVEMMAGMIGEFEVIENINGLMDIFKVIRKKGIKSFMEIVFYEQVVVVQKINWGKVEYELMDEIIESFFVQNPRLKTRALGFLSNWLPKIIGMFARLTTLSSESSPLQ